jgi:hypothetical protein
MELDPLIVKLLLDSTGYNTGLKTAGASTTNASAGIKSTLTSLGLGGVVAFASITGAIAGTIAAIKELYTSTLEYGDAVRQVSMLSGITAEDASRLIMVADDYKISVSDITLASKQLAKDGISPTVDSLARLSDEYLALTTADEKEAFLMKTFGARGGIAFIEMMRAGGDAIRANSDAVSQNNILSEDQLTLQRQNESSMNEVTDAWEGLNNVIGNMLMGPGASFLNWLATSLAGWGQFMQYVNFVVGGNWTPGTNVPSPYATGQTSPNAVKKGPGPTTTTDTNTHAIRQATGGDYMVTTPTLFLAGEAGPERATFTPQSKSGLDENKLADALADAMMRKLAPFL